MNLKDLQNNWNKLGLLDPFWAIVSLKEMKDNRWEKEAFFNTGIEEIKEIIEYVKSLNLNLSFHHALDFGCGVGRLTQALANYFENVSGIDIAPSMIDLANEYNKFPQKCEYFLNDKSDLQIFSNNTFDFIYSYITLHHIEPKYTEIYLKEFLRVLKPGGVAVFQLTSEPALSIRGLICRFVPRKVLNVFFKIRFKCPAVMEMHALKKEKVIDLITNNNGTIIDIKPDKAHEAMNTWISYIYCVQKTNK
ncbi:MAG: class I SAM-dependent methyltransferase [Cyanobacteriota bacterium]